MTTRRSLFFVLGGLVGCAAVSGCYVMRPSSGAGQSAGSTPRALSADAVVVPAGYRVELVASGLTFPVGAAVDDKGRLHVVESGYSYGEDFTEPRLLRVEGDDGRTVTVASGGKGGPWTGVVFDKGNFYVADGNVLEGGRILRISPEGKIDVLVSGLPSYGDHHTNGPVVGPDGWIYFAQGTATNSGVVGDDNAKFGWLKRRPDFHDLPGQDVTLSGENFESADVLHPGGPKVRTGAFLPFGTPGQAGQVIKGSVKASGAVLRVRPAGGEPELIAWGFRNPFGLAFAADGTLFVTDNGYDERGSRPVWGAPDLLWRVQRDTWYGWPDFVGGEPITDQAFRPPGKPQPKPLLTNHPNTPPRPIAKFAVHASADGMEFSRSQNFGYVGEAFVALFGDEAPAAGKILNPVGGKVVRVNVSNGTMQDFAVNRAPQEGPGTKVGVAGLERPVSVRFDPSGDVLYIVDFGVMRHDAKGAHPERATGAIWRIRRTSSR